MDNSKHLWIDCDPGQDDAVAIIMAGFTKGLKLVGISTVFGNTTVENTTQNALDLLEYLNLDVPVFQGAKDPLLRENPYLKSTPGDSGFDGADFPRAVEKKAVSEDALYKMYKHIKRYPRKITMVLTGPMTNMALLLKTFPMVKDNIEEIVLMGGSIFLGSFTPTSEFNVFCDPEAANIVLKCQIKTTIIPLEVTTKALFSKEIFQELKTLSSGIAKNVAGMFEYLQDFYQKKYKFAFPPLHDPCVIAYLIDDSIFKVGEYFVDVETSSKMCDGRLVCDLNEVTGKSKNAFVALDIDRSKFFELVLEAIKEAELTIVERAG